MRSIPRPEIQDRRRSQLSITRRFGGEADSDSEDKEDNFDPPVMGSAHSGDETPSFLRDDGEDNAVMDDASSSDDGEIPIPGAERVSEERIEASTAAGERAIPNRDAYSPPQQDALENR